MLKLLTIRSKEVWVNPAFVVAVVEAADVDCRRENTDPSNMQHSCTLQLATPSAAHAELRVLGSAAFLVAQFKAQPTKGGAK